MIWYLSLLNALSSLCSSKDIKVDVNTRRKNSGVQTSICICGCGNNTTEPSYEVRRVPMNDYQQDLRLIRH